MMEVKEGGVKIRVDAGVFYNPKMELCRDMSSLALGALGGKELSVMDGMCATGIRGIRYKSENENVGSVEFVDLDSRACRNAKSNIRKNKLSKCSVVKAEVGEHLWLNPFDFIEIDPFGTPGPYIVPAVKAAAMNGGGVVSVTATDVAVLCGAHYKACLKNYQARPLDNEYCHENAARILLGKIARCASEYNLGLEPKMTLSRHHYVKVIAGLPRGAETAVSSIKKLGFISHCPKCLWRGTSSLVVKERCECGGQLVHAGPLWLGELHCKETIGAMRKENKTREYGSGKEMEKLLARMECETGMPATYYDLHQVSETLKVSAERMDAVIENLERAGFLVCRTHFKENSIKTNAEIDDVKEALLNVSRKR